MTPNDKVIGKWAWCVWPQPKNPKELDAVIKKWLQPRLKKDPTKVNKPKDHLHLSKGGKVGKSKYYGGYFWSGDKLFGIDDDQALKMEVRTYDGYDFLIEEKGGFDATN